MSTPDRQHGDILRDPSLWMRLLNLSGVSTIKPKTFAIQCFFGRYYSFVKVTTKIALEIRALLGLLSKDYNMIAETLKCA